MGPVDKKVDYNYVYRRGAFKGKTVREMLLSSYVECESGCWHWTRGFLPNGYGEFSYRDSTGNHAFTAHRVFAEMLGGLKIYGMTVLHSCDNRACVNPAHLSVGSAQDNIDDKVAKGRQTRGSDISFSKLSREQVLHIRRRGAENQRALAAEFGVSQAAISYVLLRKVWKHV